MIAIVLCTILSIASGFPQDIIFPDNPQLQSDLDYKVGEPEENEFMDSKNPSALLTGGVSSFSPTSSPIMIPGKPVADRVSGCINGMTSYPDERNGTICDCRPKFLYHEATDGCFAAYRQGPCAVGQYFVLPKNEPKPRCMKNPCNEDNQVLWKNTCYALKTRNTPCNDIKMWLDVSNSTLQLNCEIIDLANYSIVDAPSKSKGFCPPGSRRASCKTCKVLI